MGQGILADLRVVELSAFVAAPLAGSLLAGLGAEVIRVEQPGGGMDAQRWPVHEGRSLYRAGLDQGKLSLGIDLRSERGQELVADLVCSGGPNGGLLITNLPARGWLDYRRLAERRADLVMVVIKGTPEGGTAVDYTVNAGVGFPWVTGPEDRQGPVNNVVPAWDVATAMLTTTALLAAERHRRLTGEGQLVQIALSEVALAVAGHLGYLAEASLIEEPRGRNGNYVYGSYGRDFETSDGRRVMVCALTTRQWKSLGEATGLTASFRELAARLGVDLGDEGERFRHREPISALLEPWIGARTLAEVGEAFDATDVLWGPYRTFKQLLAEVPAASVPNASPIDFAPFARRKAGAGPAIGSDTEAVLTDILGLAAGQIEKLRQSGII